LPIGELEEIDPNLNATQKICAVLRALSEHAPAPLRSLATAAGLNKVTAFRILGTLVQEGFVRRPAGSQLYDLGPEIAVLATSLAGRLNLRAAAAPALARLAAQSGDTAVLSIRAGDEAVCIDRQTGDFPIQSNYLHPGTRRPLGVGAGALALLAAFPPAEAEGFLRGLADRLTVYPRLAFADVRSHLTLARMRGYAVVVDQIVEHMGGIAVAIRAPEGEPLGAFSILALSERITGREGPLVTLLRAAARDTEQVLASAQVATKGA
jgi:DNA-binding IclR family transcriptional regulator